MVKFTAEEKISLTDIPISLTFQPIVIKASEGDHDNEENEVDNLNDSSYQQNQNQSKIFSEWDNSKTTVRLGTEEEVTALKEGNAPENLKLGNEIKEEDSSSWMVIEEDPEPTYTEVEESTPQTCDLALTGVADCGRYECETKSISFSSTSMYQARVFSFEVKNISGTSLPFSATCVDAKSDSSSTFGEMRKSNPCPFSVEISEGTILPNASTTFTVRFYPVEVDSYYYHLRFQMPTLSNDMEPLIIPVRGTAFRPICHFDIPVNSTYLSRRAAGLRNEYNQIGPIEAPSVRIIEQMSIGIQTANIKKFLVLNLTKIFLQLLNLEHVCFCNFYIYQ